MKTTSKPAISLLAAIFLSTSPAYAAVNTWLGGSGNWNDASMWSTGLVPTAADDVIINSGTVTLSSDIQVKSYTQSAGMLKGVGNLTTDNMTWTAGKIFTAGTVTVNQQAALGVTGGHVSLFDDLIDASLEPCPNCHTANMVLNGTTTVKGKLSAAAERIINNGTLTMSGPSIITTETISQVKFSAIVNRGSIFLDAGSGNSAGFGLNSTINPPSASYVEVLSGETYISSWEGTSYIHKDSTYILRPGTQAYAAEGAYGHQALYNRGRMEIHQGSTLTLAKSYIQESGTTLLNGGVITQEQQQGYYGNGIFFSGGALHAQGVINAKVYLGATPTGGAHTESMHTSLGNEPGKLQINGNLLITSNHTLDMQIAGNEQGVGYDFIEVNNDPTSYEGNFWLAGTLNISFAENFTPQDGAIFYLISGTIMDESEAEWTIPPQMFSVFDAIHVTGLDLDKFEYQIDYIKTLLAPSSDYYWPRYNYTLALKVLAVVPEPSSYAMISLGLGLIAALTRRRSKKSA